MIVVMNPPVIRNAIPRPASISTNVAIIGWIPTTDTRNPFHKPNSSVIVTPARMATATVPRLFGVFEPAMIVRATAPEIAICAPTERSIPRVAITIVMPSDTSISGALLRRMSMSDP